MASGRGLPAPELSVGSECIRELAAVAGARTHPLLGGGWLGLADGLVGSGARREVACRLDGGACEQAQGRMSWRLDQTQRPQHVGSRIPSSHGLYGPGWWV